MSCKYLLQRNPGLGVGKRRGPQSVSGFWVTVSVMQLSGPRHREGKF